MKYEYLIRTNSDEEIKVVRAELKKCGIKFNENCTKTLRKHLLTTQELESIDLSKVTIFKTILTNGVCTNIAMKTKDGWDR